MHIRLAGMHDLADVGRCRAKAFALPVSDPNSGAVTRDGDLVWQIRRQQVCVLIAAKQTVGFISFTPNDETLFITLIAILPECQRMGLGGRLLAHAEKTAANLGLRDISLFADGKVEHNLSFYRSHGFRETDRCEDGDFSRIFYSKAVAALSPPSALSLDAA